MYARRFVTVVAGLLAAVGMAVVGVAAAAAPTIERITVDEAFPDDFLTEACGVPVTTTVRGHVTLRTFSGEGTGPATLSTLNLALTATAGDRVFRFRDVGADMLRIEPDGTAVFSIIGQVPFEFAGVLKIDVETGEAILEPRDRSEQQVARACQALTG
ncbi:MAG: hypothetical protein ACRDO4_12155 [Nocardioides sp.]